MADKTLKDVVDSLKAVDNTIKKQPKPKDISKPLKDINDSVKSLENSIKNQEKPKDMADPLKGIMTSIKGLGKIFKTPPKAIGVIDSLKSMKDSLLASSKEKTGGITDSLNSMKDNFLKSLKGLGSDKKGKGAAAEAEAAQEAARDAKESKQIQKDILATLKAGVGGAVQKDKKQGGLIAGLLGGIGAGIGSIGKAVSKIGPKFVIGMASLGGGIGAFLLAVGTAGLIAKYSGMDGEALKTLISNFFGAFSGRDMVALGLLLAGAVTIGKLDAEKDVMLGMGAIGVGIAAFFAGVLLGEGVAKLAGLVGLDGTNLATLIKNFTTAFAGTGADGLKTMGALLIGAVGLKFIKGGKTALILGMASIGAGIAAFMIPMVAADWIASFGTGENLKVLLSNVGQAIGGFIGGIGSGIFKQLETINTEKLGALGTGIKDIGLGMMAFAGGQAAGVVGGVMESVAGFFGKDSPLEQVAALSKDKDINVARLQELGLGIRSLAEGMSSFAAVDSATMSKNAMSLAIAVQSARGEEKGMFDSAKSFFSSFLGAPTKAATGGLITTRSAGIFELHQGEMIMDNDAVAAFRKSLDLMNMSQENALAGAGGGPPIIINNNNVDNSMQSSQTTAVSIPEPTRTNESTVRALQNN